MKGSTALASRCLRSPPFDELTWVNWSRKSCGGGWDFTSEEDDDDEDDEDGEVCVLLHFSPSQSERWKLTKDCFIFCFNLQLAGYSSFICLPLPDQMRISKNLMDSCTFALRHILSSVRRTLRLSNEYFKTHLGNFLSWYFSYSGKGIEKNNLKHTKTGYILKCRHVGHLNILGQGWVSQNEHI